MVVILGKCQYSSGAFPGSDIYYNLNTSHGENRDSTDDGKNKTLTLEEEQQNNKKKVLIDFILYAPVYMFLKPHFVCTLIEPS